MIIATAGHVDHGKTALIQTLTGVNADRLPEEKKRGMTIEPGYAYQTLADGRTLGFIDVPGHEKFLANMLSGIGGIDHALLVVACDDGVMAQTREHLTLLRLSGRPPLTLVLSKADRADEQLQKQVAAQAQQLIRELGWPPCPCFITSALDGRGMNALRTHLAQLTAKPPQETRPFRLAIDRVFTLKGSGLIVTGTALSGQIHTGETLWLSGGRPVRLRSLHVQNQPADKACGGQRVALNISGDITKEDISRGDWLLSCPRPAGSERLIVALDMLTPLKHWQPVHIHHGVRHITGRISLLDTRLAELILDAPLWLVENDRLILRDISAQQTLAAARVILLHYKRRGKRHPNTLAWLHALADADGERQAIYLQLQQQAGDYDELAFARQLTPDALDAILASLHCIRAGRHLLLPETAGAWQQHLLSVLKAFHQSHSDQPGIGRDRLRRIALPTQPAALVNALIDDLLRQQRLTHQQGWLRCPDFSVTFNRQQAALWQHIAPLFIAGGPHWVRDIATRLQQDEEPVRQVLRIAAQRGQITAVVKDRYFSQQQIHTFASLIRKHAREGRATTAADFRNQLGCGRKLAIQILEFFDRSGFTRRSGNQHLLRDEQLFLATDQQALAQQN